MRLYTPASTSLNGILFLEPYPELWCCLTKPQNITKIGLYNFDPLKPRFYIVKLGFTGVYIIFLISAQKHRLWVLVRTASVLTSTHNLCFEQKYEKYQNFLIENFHFFVVKFSVYLNRHVFVMILDHWSMSSGEMGA